MVLDINSAIKADVAITLIIYDDEYIRQSTGDVLLFEFLRLDKELIALSVVKQLEGQPGILFAVDTSFPEKRRDAKIFAFLSHGIDILKLSDIVALELNSTGCSVCRTIRHFSDEGEATKSENKMK